MCGFMQCKSINKNLYTQWWISHQLLKTWSIELGLCTKSKVICKTFLKMGQMLRILNLSIPKSFPKCKNITIYGKANGREGMTLMSNNYFSIVQSILDSSNKVSIRKYSSHIPSKIIWVSATLITTLRFLYWVTSSCLI